MTTLGELITRLFLRAFANFLPCLRALMRVLRAMSVTSGCSKKGGSYCLPPPILDQFPT